MFFTIGSSADVPLDIVLGLVAGFFIYVAVSDIIPSIHKSEEKVLAGPQTILLLIGVIVVGSMTTYLHQFIDTDTHDTGTHSSEVHSDDELHTEEEMHSSAEESDTHTE
jgi:hypothetical protein